VHWWVLVHCGLKRLESGLFSPCYFAKDNTLQLLTSVYLIKFVMDLRWQASLSRFIQISPEWGWLFIELSLLVEPSPILILGIMHEYQEWLKGPQK
jgi:hypothetical protein